MWEAIKISIFAPYFLWTEQDNVQSFVVVFDFFQNALECVISANPDQVIQYLNFSKDLRVYNY